MTDKKRSRKSQSGSASALEDADIGPLPKDYKPTTFPNIPVDGNPQQVWDEFFATHKPLPIELHRPFKAIFELKDHEGAIAFLEAAIRHGQGRTWMYEVLPLEMKLAGRADDDVERAMLSRSDFRTVDQSSMMLSAAYLVRFQQLPRALHLYRQASSLDPLRPEPYALGLRLAQQLNDNEAVKWAALGILNYVWTRNHDPLHRQAENALLDLQQSLRRAGKTAEAEDVAAKLAQAKIRDMVILLRWQGDADLDLAVEEPNGAICSLHNQQSPAGGVFVHDGFGPDQKETYEQIVYPMAMSGTYRIKVQHVWGRVVAKRAVLTVIQHQGTDKPIVKTQTITLGDEETVVRVELENGRRAKPLSVSTLRTTPMPAAPRGAVRGAVATTPDGRRARQEFLNARQRTQRPPRRAGVAYQPVISVIPEGSSLTAGAVVSGDRRYVRMRLTPTFSNITDVFTFSFLNSGGQQTQPAPNPGGN